MARYSSESSRGARLESYNGAGYTLERIKEGDKSTRVNRLYAPILGGIQPERLLSIAAKSSVDDDLQARLIAFWPDFEFVPMVEHVERVDWLEGVSRTLRDIEMDVN